MPERRWSSAALAALVMVGCAGDRPQALAPAQGGVGPRVVFEPLRTPDAELPLPNDLATRPDPDSLTGRRLNLAVLSSPLAAERRIRQKLDRLDGWSVFAPITVAFDAPLDLATVTDASVRLVDVTSSSPEFLESIPLDLGRGAYPAEADARELFPGDPDGTLTDLLFPPDNQVDGARVEHWEVATNTLILRPMRALRPKTTYAVVLTRAVQGVGGASVRSPFPGTNAPEQTEALRPVLQVVPAPDLAFTWSFTTQSIADDMVALREGLDGRGAFAWLEAEFPGRIAGLTDLQIPQDGDGSLADKGLPEAPRDHRYTLQPQFLKVALGPFIAVGLDLGALDFSHVDYFVFGRLDAPDFRDSADGGLWPDARTGAVSARHAFIPFTLSVPKPSPGHSPPFPVVLYCHGARTSRFELTLVADAFAQRGYAMMGLDAVGHGPFGGDLKAILRREAPGADDLLAALLGQIGAILFPPTWSAEGKDLDEVFEDLDANGLWQTLFVDGRSTDEDKDGILESGDGYFVPDPFALAANSRQTVLDTLFSFRVLRRFDPASVPSDPVPDPRNAPDEVLLPHLLAGDFNADGVLDVGGPDVAYAVAGTSLGGIHTSMVIALEPDLHTAVPIVSGGGMTDMLTRSSLDGAVNPVLVEAVGPAVVGCPVEGGVSLSLSHRSGRCRDLPTISRAQVGMAPRVPGGTATLENPRLLALAAPLDEARHTSLIRADGSFSVTVAADANDRLLLTLKDADGAAVGLPIDVIADRDGLGRARNSPRFRRLLQAAQTAVDRGDPIAWARYLLREPLPGSAPKNVLHLADIGDRTVPFAAMVAWDRAAGLHGLDDVASTKVTEAFLEHDGLRGATPWDIDDLAKTADGIGPLPSIETPSGRSAVRYAATGKHEYIATPKPNDPNSFDWATYSRNQLLRFIESGGKDIVDDLCMEDSSCPWLK